MIAAWTKAVRAFAHNEAVAGRPPAGYKLVTGRRGNRKWLDEDAAAAALGRDGVQPYVQDLISPAVAEKQLKAFGKTLAADLVTQAPGSPELVPEGDKRPAIACGPESVFSAVETTAD